MHTSKKRQLEKKNSLEHEKVQIQIAFEHTTISGLSWPKYEKSGSHAFLFFTHPTLLFLFHKSSTISRSQF